MKFNLKSILWLFSILIGIVGLSILIICFPQIYYFKDKIEYKNFQVYYDKKIPDQIYATLDAVEQSIQKSECYNPHLKFKIFLRSDANNYGILPLQFPDRGSGQAVPIIQNVFLYKSDCATNTTYNHMGHARALSSVISHELIHILVDDKWFLKSKMAYFDHDDVSPFGALWKEEGYAEYIAGGAAINLDNGLKILKNEAMPEYIPHVEYFKYWLAVRYLITKKQMSFEEILNTNLKLDDVLAEAISSSTQK